MIKIVWGRIWKDIKNFRIAIVILLLYEVITMHVFQIFCPFLIVTGFPCAGCGLTRAVFCILTGQFITGLRLNPAAPLWIVFLCWFFINRYLKGTNDKRTKVWYNIKGKINLQGECISETKLYKLFEKIKRI